MPAWMPVPESPVVGPGSMGGPFGSPVTEKAPAAAWAQVLAYVAYFWLSRPQSLGSTVVELTTELTSDAGSTEGSGGDDFHERLRASCGGRTDSRN